jgi:hypothetical protein
VWVYKPVAWLASSINQSRHRLHACTVHHLLRDPCPHTPGLQCLCTAPAVRDPSQLMHPDTSFIARILADVVHKSSLDHAHVRLCPLVSLRWLHLLHADHEMLHLCFNSTYSNPVAELECKKNHEKPSWAPVTSGLRSQDDCRAVSSGLQGRYF